MGQGDTVFPWWGVVVFVASVIVIALVMVKAIVSLIERMGH